MGELGGENMIIDSFDIGKLTVALKLAENFK